MAPHVWSDSYNEEQRLRHEAAQATGRACVIDYTGNYVCYMLAKYITSDGRMLCGIHRRSEMNRAIEAGQPFHVAALPPAPKDVLARRRPPSFRQGLLHA